MDTSNAAVVNRVKSGNSPRKGAGDALRHRAGYDNAIFTPAYLRGCGSGTAGELSAIDRSGAINVYA